MSRQVVRGGLGLRDGVWPELADAQGQPSDRGWACARMVHGGFRGPAGFGAGLCAGFQGARR